MCFPTKKQKANFDADEKPKAAAKSTPSTTAKGSPAATLVSTAGAGKGPKIAIVIYTMYGHITTSASFVCVLLGVELMCGVGSGGERKGWN
jgi:hypothetical protein